jgi:hypothetical protein
MFRAHLDAAGIGVDLELKSAGGVSIVTRLWSANRNSLPLASNKSELLADNLSLVVADLDYSSTSLVGSGVVGGAPHKEVLEDVSSKTVS